jgi:hypothetical protein
MGKDRGPSTYAFERLTDFQGVPIVGRILIHDGPAKFRILRNETLSLCFVRPASSVFVDRTRSSQFAKWTNLPTSDCGAISVPIDLAFQAFESLHDIIEW